MSNLRATPVFYVGIKRTESKPGNFFGFWLRPGNYFLPNPSPFLVSFSSVSWLFEGFFDAITRLDFQLKLLKFLRTYRVHHSKEDPTHSLG